VRRLPDETPVEQVQFYTYSDMFFMTTFQHCFNRQAKRRRRLPDETPVEHVQFYTYSDLFFMTTFQHYFNRQAKRGRRLPDATSGASMLI